MARKHLKVKTSGVVSLKTHGSRKPKLLAGFRSPKHPRSFKGLTSEETFEIILKKKAEYKEPSFLVRT